MERPHYRPRVTLLVRSPVDEVRAALQARLDGLPGVLEGRVRQRAVLAWIAAPERRFWSPSVELTLEEHTEGTLVRGVFGPHPNLMTGQLFLTILLSFLGAIASTWAFVQVTMDEAPVCLWGAAAALTGVVALALARALGLAWGRDQVARLGALVDGLGEILEEDAGVLHVYARP
jgi:hypothetical protein